MRGLVILGSTGSIGCQTLDIVRAFPDDFRVIGLAAGYNLELLQRQIEEFEPRLIHSPGFDIQNKGFSNGTIVTMEEMVSDDEVDLVMVATVGAIGLMPTIRCIEKKKSVALANKEVIIMAGEFIKKLSVTNGTPLLPVDSEPSAIWQCIQGESDRIRRLIITASGGPFRESSTRSLKDVTVSDALKHPTWKMGRKITIDSATLMNKAFEVIEAHWLFDVPFENIEVVIHPQSIVHSMVEMTDGSIKAQMGPPDMKLPIQYALFYPKRIENQDIPRLDMSVSHKLTFDPIITGKYPCFDIAIEAGKMGGSYPAVLSAANEVAVKLFLEGKLRFLGIQNILEGVISSYVPVHQNSIDSIIEADKWSRSRSMEIFETMN